MNNLHSIIGLHIVKLPALHEVKVIAVFIAAMQHWRCSFVMWYSNLFLVVSTVPELASLYFDFLSYISRMSFDTLRWNAAGLAASSSLMYRNGERYEHQESNVFSVKKMRASRTSPHGAPCGCAAFGFIGSAVSGEIAVSYSLKPFLPVWLLSFNEKWGVQKKSFLTSEESKSIYR